MNLSGWKSGIGGWLLMSAAIAELPPPELKRIPLQFASFSFYSENDKYFAGTDEDYTNGFKISAISAKLSRLDDEPVPQPIRFLASQALHALPDGPEYNVGFSLGQNMYTPRDTETPQFIPDDRPYSAWLYGGVSFHARLNDTRPIAGGPSVDQLHTIELNLGVVGPEALGQETQDAIHDLINTYRSGGWRHQIKHELGANLVYERKFRWSISSRASGWSADIIPHIGFSLGNIDTYVNAGAEIRAGWNLPDDFGTKLIRAGGTSNRAELPQWSLFLFCAVDGRAVERDISLDGDPAGKNSLIQKEPFIADLHAGLAIGGRYAQITYAQALRTKAFKGQPDSFEFGSVSISFFY
tara:strand:+ start:2116 stop:3177 length:1062 start_codon:yes stop_codon:yes gene_type:complete